jgi:FtsH-binding integral membrane protein
MTQLLIRFDVYAYILGALFVMIGGAMMMLSGFQDEWVSKGKQTITWALIGVFIGKFASVLVGFVSQEANSVGGGELVVAVVNTAIGSVFDLFRVGLIAVTIFCGMRMVVARGKSDEMEKGRTGLIWAAVGAIIINIAQVITNAIATL